MEFPYDHVGEMLVDTRMAKFVMPSYTFTQLLEALEEQMYKFETNQQDSMCATESKVLQFAVESAELMLDEEFAIREELTQYVRYHKAFDFHTYSKAFFKPYKSNTSLGFHDCAFLGPFVAHVVPLQAGSGKVITTITPSTFNEQRVSLSDARLIAVHFTKQHCEEAHQILNKFRHIDFTVMSTDHFNRCLNFMLTKERLLQTERGKQAQAIAQAEDEIEEDYEEDELVRDGWIPHVECLRADKPCCMSAPHTPSPTKFAIKKRRFDVQ